jgi:imidazolonepropionase-like amidohydrolase
MPSRRLVIVVALFCAACDRQPPDHFVRVRASTIALTHARLIDGNGVPAQANQTVIIQDGRIRQVGPSARVAAPAVAQVIDLSGRTVMPGFVGMHEHLFYQLEPASGTRAVTAQTAFAKLYLAAGVTTIRTAGTVDFRGDLRMKRLIDEGAEAGPRIDVSGPYLHGIGAQPHPDEIRQQVIDAADEGATSFKAYTSLRASELRAAIAAAHERGFTITGHLCAVGYRDAAALGIDNIEHGIIHDTEFYSGKKPDECPNLSKVYGELLYTEITDDSIRQTMADLIRHGVAITSTLAVFESYTGRPSGFDPRVPVVLSSRLQSVYEDARAQVKDPNAAWPRAWARLLDKEMQFEAMFVRAGGRLMAGVDPTGWGGVMAGFGDQRELELLVEAGLQPEVAIRVATLNGAMFLRRRDIGVVEEGARADLVVVRGDPTAHISDIRNVETVFKDGVGYDPTALVAATAGTVTDYDFTRLLRWPWNAILGAWLLSVVIRRVWRARRRRPPVIAQEARA